MDLDLTGKHALVCGASEGIGRATARELALLGADVTLLARRADVLRNARRRAAAQRRPAARLDRRRRRRHRTPARAGRRRSPRASPCTSWSTTPAARRAARRMRAESDAFEPRSASTCSPTRCSCRRCCRACAPRAAGRIVNVISTSVKEPIAGLGVSNTIRGAVASWAKTLATRTRRATASPSTTCCPATRARSASTRSSRDRAQATGQAEDAIAKRHARDRAGRPLRRCRPRPPPPSPSCARPAAGYINGINLPVDGGRTKSL